MDQKVSYLIGHVGVHFVLSLVSPYSVKMGVHLFNKRVYPSLLGKVDKKRLNPILLKI